MISVINLLKTNSPDVEADADPISPWLTVMGLNDKIIIDRNPLLSIKQLPLKVVTWGFEWMDDWMNDWKKWTVNHTKYGNVNF